MFWQNLITWLLAKETKSSAGIKAKSMEECLNCSNGLKIESSFCPICGQKTHETKLTLFSLLSDFFGSLFNLDNGIYRSFVGLPIPGFLSKQFMSGKRKSYLNPVRLFLITLIIHLSTLTNLVPFERINRSLTQYHEELGQSKIYHEFTDIKTTSPDILSGCNVDTLEQVVFRGLRGREDSTSYTLFDNAQLFGRGAKGEYRVADSDLFDMPIEEFIETYEIETWWEKMTSRQLLRTLRDPSGAIRFGVGNLTWSVLSTIIILGLYMKLLYIRRKRYFVEHLIVLFNIHSFAFLIASIEIWIKTLRTMNDPVTAEFTVNFGGLSYIIIAVFFFLSIKFYYQQGWIKSWIKFTMVGITYFVTLISMIVLVTLISLFFFN